MKSCKLYCTKCRKEFDGARVIYRCDVCGEPLEVEKVCGKISEGNVLEQTSLERYKEFFPFLDIRREVIMGEGFTPIIEKNRLAKDIGIKNLWFKNETTNPTWSFKDRGTVTGVMHALTNGYEKIGTVSTGNMAVSVAAYGGNAGLTTYILVSKSIADEKLNPIAIHGANLIRVDGDYGKLYYETLEIGDKHNICFINSDAPFRVVGYKVLAYEICEQLNFNIPDFVVVPTSAGGHIRGILRGFEEFFESGYIQKIPTMVCAQASGCCPIDRAFRGGENHISRFENPKTIAHAIENPLPPSGTRVVNMLRELGGYTVSSTEEEIIKAQGILAAEGFFVQPASACGYAGMLNLIKEGKIGKEDTVACVLTGGGLKYTTAFTEHELSSHLCKIEDLERFIANDLK